MPLSAMVGRPKRKRQVELGPPVRGGTQSELAAHQLGQTLGDGESQTGAIRGPSVRLLGLPERLEDALDIGWVDANAGVPDVEVCVRVIVPKPDADFARRGELDGIGGQVEQNLLEPGWVGT